jgi:hypothetical protein
VRFQQRPASPTGRSSIPGVRYVIMSVIESSLQPHEVDTSVTPNLQLKKTKHREAKALI